VLELANLRICYGPVLAVHDISLTLMAGKIVALIGANGAGKSTTLKTISGLLRPAGGTITLEGRRIDGLSPEAIVGLGIAHVPEGRRVFPGLSVFENLDVATAAWYRKGLNTQDELKRVYDLFPGLKQRQNQLAWSMSGGEQQMLAVGRALMSRPKILLLDEPSLGLAPLMVDRVYDAIQEIRRSGIGILLVEQNAFLALETADWAHIMVNGQIVRSGEAKELLEDPSVQEAYLGRGEATLDKSPEYGRVR
jgi:branched-chain amino acid transport system ATP-binding protein